MTKTYAVLGVVVAVILVVYNLLPERRFVESVFPMVNGEGFMAYDDRGDGGNSLVESSLEDDAFNFSCSLGTDTTRGAWCGVLFELSDVAKKKFRKWNFVDTVFLDVESHGTKEILLQLWTYDPDVTEIEKKKSFRLLMKEISLKDGRQLVRIPMEDFYTPEFWFDEYGKKANRSRRSLESVARLEITSGWNQPRGQKYSLKVREITVSGVSNLYFGMVLGLIVVVAIVAIGLRHPHKED